MDVPYDIVSPDPGGTIESLRSLGYSIEAAVAELTTAVEGVHMMMRTQANEVDRGLLDREVHALVAINRDEAAGRDDHEGHNPWLAEGTAEHTWEFCERYRQYIEDVKLLSRQAMFRLGQSTDRVLNQPEDPRRAGYRHRYGLVVGQVQSGRTGNCIGLARKAADTGYKLIVVLAGMQDSLRSQTQRRVNEDLLGFDNEYQQRSDDEAGAAPEVGVGLLPGRGRAKIGSLTSSAENGDFRRDVAKNTAIPIGDDPVILVNPDHKSDSVDDAEPFVEAASEAVVEVARRIHGALISQDSTPGEARSQIRHMWPFEHRPRAET